MQISEMNRDSAKQIRQKLNELFGLLDGDTNIDFTLGHGTFDPALGEVSFKLTAKVQGSESKELVDAKRIAPIVEIPESAFTTPVKSFFNGKERMIVIEGYKSRARKNPWVIRDTVSNNVFVVDQNFVQQQFRKVA